MECGGVREGRHTAPRPARAGLWAGSGLALALEWTSRRRGDPAALRPDCPEDRRVPGPSLKGPRRGRGAALSGLEY